MIKVETNLKEKQKIVQFAFQASSEADLKTLDLLLEALMDLPQARTWYFDSKRLILEKKGLDHHFEKEPTEAKL